MKKQTIAPCNCSQQRKFSIQYCDQVVRSDLALSLVIGFLDRLSLGDPPSPKEIYAVSIILEDYLHQKIENEHKWFGRPNSV